MDTFEKFILKQLIGPLTYNEQSATITAQMKPLLQSQRDAIHREGRKWKLTPQQVEQTIDRVQSNFAKWSTCSERHAERGAFNLTFMPEGTQINITAHDERLNTEVTLQLLHLGRHDGATTPRLLVLSNTRTSILPGDEVEPYADVYFSVGHALLLRVYRGGQRWPDEQQVFHIDKITDLSQQVPSVLCEIADNTRSFTFLEERVQKKEGTYTLGRNPMSFLLHRHSTLMPLYADFDNDAQNAMTPSSNYVPGHTDALTDEETQLLFGQAKQALTPQPKPKGTFFYAETEHRLGFE